MKVSAISSARVPKAQAQQVSFKMSPAALEELGNAALKTNQISGYIFKYAPSKTHTFYDSLDLLRITDNGLVSSKLGHVFGDKSDTAVPVINRMMKKIFGENLLHMTPQKTVEANPFGVIPIILA